MISEIEFIRDYTSFWRTLSPLSQDFIRQINIYVINKERSELSNSFVTSRIALINEVGFEIFYRCKTNGTLPDTMTLKELDDISNQVNAYISQLRNQAPLFQLEMNASEIIEAKEIAGRLLNFFQNFKNVIIKPEFVGCGRLNSCKGDVIADDILFEIKSGSGRFKSIDLRQLALYLALNYYSKQYDIQSLGLYNPRKDYKFTVTHQEFSLQFSGLSTEELCHRIGYELTTVDLGRFDEII